MKDALRIKKIAVLGAGVMGAQIAAHCVNSGFETFLYDLNVPDEPKNSLILKAIQNLTKLTPPPLGSIELVSKIIPKNYQDDLEQLSQCDLIIEAIVERLDLKIALYKNISPYLTPETILVSNSSGLSMNELSQVLPPKNQSRFCGVHFFNPPRYMHLAELIPTKSTSPLLLDALETWLTSYLGKGVVRAKDTPNFIANRIGVFSLLATIHHAEKMGLSIDEVDALTGTLIGRPKSATYRTMDVVGLDTMQHVIQAMQNTLENDPWFKYFHLPEWIIQLIKAGSLGQKTGKGLYLKKGSSIEVFSPQNQEYRPMQGIINDEVKCIFKQNDATTLYERLCSSQDKQAQFLSAYLTDLYHYCAYHLEGISDNVRDVDNAMKWGFGWEKGPFETWQNFGIFCVREEIEKRIQNQTTMSSVLLPTWLRELTCFYSQEGAYSLSLNDYQKPKDLLVYQRQITLPHEPILFENEGVKIVSFSSDVAVLSFKSKANVINQAVLDGLQEGITRAEANGLGLVIYQEDVQNFSAGADLRMVGSLIQTKENAQLRSLLASFQQTVMRIKYSSIPVVAALSGKALGGGCELLMHCSSVVAAFESYPGLVEVGVGLIPAGGGCKEFALRAAVQSNTVTEHRQLIQKYFEQIAMAKVATSALDAKNKDFLSHSDLILMNNHEVLYGAIQLIQFKQALNYKAPLAQTFKVVGREGHAQLKAGLVNWLEGGFISQHDYLIANHIASILSGGEVFSGQEINESWILQLELNAFMELAETALTQDRIRYLLETGKPLRN